MHVDLSGGGTAALERANAELGLALSPGEIEYLCDAYRDLGRSPTDAELMMFAQARITSYNVCYTKLLRFLQGKSKALIQVLEEQAAGIIARLAEGRA